jgi:predicted Na+-dependent transporter
MTLLMLCDLWPSLALLYYAAGSILLLWILAGHSEAYQRLSWRDSGWLIIAALFLWIWPLMLLGLLLGKAFEPSGRAETAERRVW